MSKKKEIIVKIIKDSVKYNIKEVKKTKNKINYYDKKYANSDSQINKEFKKFYQKVFKTKISPQFKELSEERKESIKDTIIYHKRKLRKSGKNFLKNLKEDLKNILNLK